MTMLEITTLAEGNLGDARAATTRSVSWSAVIAGAIVAVASSLVLLLFGSGLGLSMVSPWSFNGVSPTTFAVSTAIWLIVVQWLSSALGGYLTGRLRTRWVGLHGDESFFRDTAHGLLMWALATVLVASVLSSAATAIAARGAGSPPETIAQTPARMSSANVEAASSSPTGYYVDLMFRPEGEAILSSNAVTAAQFAANSRAEAARILKMPSMDGRVSAADTSYLARLVVARTGRSSADAQAHVADVLLQMDLARTRVKETLEKTRKAGITTSLLTVLALIVGAFIASAAAAFGGHVRDEM